MKKQIFCEFRIDDLRFSPTQKSGPIAIISYYARKKPRF